MKRLLVLAVPFLSVGIAQVQVITDLQFNCGDSAHYWINRNQIEDIDLNIDGTHVWDMTEPFGSEKTEIMKVCEVAQGSAGSQFPNAQWVVTNHDPEGGTMYEAYMGRDRNVILLYGYVYDVTGRSILAPYDGGKGDSLYVFPMNLGKQWNNSLRSTVGDTLFIVTLYKKIVDTGQVLTEIGTFPCTVMLTHMITNVYVFGFLRKYIIYYQYDWLVDTMASVATILSRQGESRERFEVAERTQRVKELWLSGNGPGSVVEMEYPESLSLEAFPYPRGIRICYSTSGAKKIDLTCYDASGRRLLTKLIQSDPGEHELLLTDLAPGVYFIRLALANESLTTRCVVIR